MDTIEERGNVDRKVEKKRGWKKGNEVEKGG